MATCVRQPRQIESVAHPPVRAVRIVMKPVPEEYDIAVPDTLKVVEEVFHLSLSRQEAETLRMIGWRVGGDPLGRRGHVDAIINALDGAGLPDMCEAQRGLPETSRIYLR